MLVVVKIMAVTEIMVITAVKVMVFKIADIIVVMVKVKVLVGLLLAFQSFNSWTK
jgi:hypothetical protein